MTGRAAGASGAIAFALIYFTFFLDNVLLTVLVPIIPDWVRGESLALWSTQRAPLAALLNHTVHAGGGGAGASDVTPGKGAGAGSGTGMSQAVVGLVLGAKAAAQLACAAPAAAAVCRRGPAAVLRAGTLTLALAALVLAGCGRAGGGAAAWCVGAGRALHGAGAALAAVAGLALAAALPLDPPRRDRAIGALLGAVALGVLVGYPFGGATDALWTRGAPFLLLAAALLTDLAMQHMFLDEDEFNRGCWAGGSGGAGGAALCREAARGGTRACAGAVLLTTCVMAALEPCLPLWIMDKFHPQRWTVGAVFIPDSAGYFVATSALGGAARALGAERVALAGQLAVGLAALAVPHATSVGMLALPHAWLGLGLGALDAALVPALLARRPRRAPARAALLQAASSAAAAIGPVLGGVMSWCVGFESALRTLGVANLLYAALLYRALSAHPLSEQWGASTPDDADSDEEGEEGEGGEGGGGAACARAAEMTPLNNKIYAPLR